TPIPRSVHRRGCARFGSIRWRIFLSCRRSWLRGRTGFRAPRWPGRTRGSWRIGWLRLACLGARHPATCSRRMRRGTTGGSVRFQRWGDDLLRRAGRRRCDAEDLAQRDFGSGPVLGFQAAGFAAVDVDDGGGHAADLLLLGFRVLEVARQAVVLEMDLRGSEQVLDLEEQGDVLAAVRAPGAEEDAHGHRLGLFLERGDRGLVRVVALRRAGVLGVVLLEIGVLFDPEEGRVGVHRHRLALGGEGDRLPLDVELALRGERRVGQQVDGAVLLLRHLHQLHGLHRAGARGEEDRRGEGAREDQVGRDLAVLVDLRALVFLAANQENVLTDALEAAEYGVGGDGLRLGGPGGRNDRDDGGGGEQQERQAAAERAWRARHRDLTGWKGSGRIPCCGHLGWRGQARVGLGHPAVLDAEGPRQLTVERAEQLGRRFDDLEDRSHGPVEGG